MVSENACISQVLSQCYFYLYCTDTTPLFTDNRNHNNANNSGDDEDGGEGEEEGGSGVNQAADFDRMMRSELIKVEASLLLVLMHILHVMCHELPATSLCIFITFCCIQKRQMELAAESAKYNNNNSNNNNRSFTGVNTSNGDDVVIMDHSGMEDALHGTFLPVVLFFFDHFADQGT